MLHDRQAVYSAKCISGGSSNLFLANIPFTLFCPSDTIISVKTVYILGIDIAPSSIYICIKNDKINSYLERVITEEAMAEQLNQSLNGIETETANTQLLADKFLLDLTKEELCKNTDVL